MNGIEIAEKYYKQFGEPMLEGQFPALMCHIAVGIAGEGSDCFGFDDEISRDHDFEPGFCIFADSLLASDRKAMFNLERAYAALPKEFEGLHRQLIAPPGGSRRGVIPADEFFEKFTGYANGPLTAAQFVSVPDYALAQAVNGKVFRDDGKSFSKTRAYIADIPEDARRKKLAGYLFLMAQSGQYNYYRCVLHGETGAAALAAAEFVKNAISALYMLNKKYCPFYKWAFRGLRQLEIMPQLADTFEYLISSGNEGKDAQDKRAIIDDVCRMFADELVRQGLSGKAGDSLEEHAYLVNGKISDLELRGQSIIP